MKFNSNPPIWLKYSIELTETSAEKPLVFRYSFMLGNVDNGFIIR